MIVSDGEGRSSHNCRSGPVFLYLSPDSRSGSGVAVCTGPGTLSGSGVFNG